MSTVPGSRPIGQPFSPSNVSGDAPGGGAGAAGAITVVVLAISSVFLLQGGDNMRIMLAASLAIILFALNNYSPVAGVALTVSYLAMLGGIKRGLFAYFGYAKLDPMLLVVPAVVILFFVTRLIRREISRDTLISKMISALLVIMFLEVLNPLQGGLTVGLAGGLFYIAPLLWFYIGRAVGTAHVVRTALQMVIIVAFFGALYGFYQTWFGFSAIEKEWLVITQNDSTLNLTRGVTRVFLFLVLLLNMHNFCVLLRFYVLSSC